MPEISIIVPVYNAEKYLSRCIDSILVQSFKDFELLLVDDGSSDNSRSICDDYALKDSRVIVKHKKNGGVSSARNLALSMAKGKYVMFCDADDYVDSRWCGIMYKNIAENPNAFIVSDVWRVSTKGEASQLVKNKPNNINYYNLFVNGISGFPFNKIYRLDTIKNNNITFNIGCPIGEDVAFNVEYCKLCTSIEYIDVPLYYYCDNEICATKRYYSDLLQLHLNCFVCRLPLIAENELTDFCDYYLSYLIPIFDNVFDKRNSMPFLKKLKFNQEVITSQEFKFCLDNASGKNESEKLLNMLRKHNYYLWYIFKLGIKIKNLFKV